MKLLPLIRDTVPIIQFNYNIKCIHFIGIGGSGMCGIACVLVQQGYYVTGSDVVEQNDTIRYLQKLGVKIFFKHCCNNVIQANIVVVSSAIALDNPEVKAAKQLKIPIMKRAEILSELMKYQYGIAVAGTHGKTTTTAMLTNIYIEAGLDPTFINGGIIKSEGVQARFGYSRYFIAEADESDKSLLWLHPKVAIVTNIDVDHMNTYHQNLNYLKQTFIKFLYNLPVYGYAVVCIDNPIIQDILPKINRKIITYGFSKDANVRIVRYYQNIGKSEFTILIKNSTTIRITLNTTPGCHNALNATAAIAVSVEEGIHETYCIRAMSNFQGINRRFENLGNYDLYGINGKSGKIMLIDDYGHHPVELQATIMAIRSGWPNNRLIMIFQPHRFTRTYDLFFKFINVLSNVDILLILDIYSAGEKPIMGIDSCSLCEAIRKYGKIIPIFVPDSDFLSKILSKFLQDNDLILIQGAGTISKVVRLLFTKNYSCKFI